MTYGRAPTAYDRRSWAGQGRQGGEYMHLSPCAPSAYDRGSWAGCVPAPYERSSWGDSAPLPDDRGSSGDKGQGQGQSEKPHVLCVAFGDAVT